MNKIKLNKIENFQLTNNEKHELKGGADCRCQCGCCYANNGGSDVGANANANAKFNGASTACENVICVIDV